MIIFCNSARHCERFTTRGDRIRKRREGGVPVRFARDVFEVLLTIPGLTPAFTLIDKFVRLYFTPVLY